MEAHAQTMLTPTPAPVGLALPVSTAKPTYLIVQKGVCVRVCVCFSHGDISCFTQFVHTPMDRTTECDIKIPTFCVLSTALALMEEHAQIKSMAIPVRAAQASLAPIASMRSMSVTPSPASMEASVKMPWSPSVAPAQRATLATAARYTLTHKHSWLCHYTIYVFRLIHFFICLCLTRLQLSGADAHLPAKMEDAVARRMLPLSVNVLTAGLDVIVTSLGSPVKQLLAREVFLCCLHDEIWTLHLCFYWLI